MQANNTTISIFRAVLFITILLIIETINNPDVHIKLNKEYINMN